MHIIENWEWYIHCDVNSNDEVTLGVCLFHPVFLVTSWVTSLA